MHLTFVIKSNNIFSLNISHRILVTTHRDKPAGNWFDLDAVISDAKIMEMACLWNQCGVSSIMSATESAELHDNKCLSTFDDYFGIISTKEINRPNVLDVLCDYLHLIDEHNNQRQSTLCMGRKTYVKDWWIRLLVTIARVSAVRVCR